MFRRHRRLRKNSVIRDMVRETSLNKNDFIYPLFVIDGNDIKQEIPSLDNNYQYSVDRLQEIVDEMKDAGVKSVILFGLPEHKDEVGSQAYAEDGIVQRAIRKLKDLYPELFVITDVCMCEYTSHGHCGIIHDHEVDNDETLEYIAKTCTFTCRSWSRYGCTL